MNTIELRQPPAFHDRRPCFLATRCLLATVLALCATVSVAAPADAYLSYTGTAVARHSDRFLYGERHILRFEGGRLAERTVLYTCSDGAAFARKSVQYVDPTAPDYLLDDPRSGVREGVRSSGAGREVFIREKAAAPERAGPLPEVRMLVADAGFDEFVQQNWARLVRDEAVQMRFLVTPRLTDYGFQVQRLRSETYRGVHAEVFRLRLSGFWGWFLPGIDVVYDAAGRTLLHYDGVSNLRDAGGDNLKVDVDFPQQDRHPATEQAMRDARAAPLRSCG
jgi:hypothetical protein